MNNNLFATPQAVGQVEMSFDDPAAGVLITPRLAAYTAHLDPEPLQIPAAVIASAAPTDLRDLLAKFPQFRGNSNKWPGLRIALNDYQTFRVILDAAADQAVLKGAKGDRARREYGRLDLANGRTHGFSPDMEALMDELWRDPVAFCSAHGRDRGYCCFCCAPLSTIESRERGYGPVCASHHGLPWGG